MARIFFQQHKTFVGKVLYIFRQFVVMLPKTGGSPVFHFAKGVLAPRESCAAASCAIAPNLFCSAPLLASSSICASHKLARNSSNLAQAQKPQRRIAKCRAARQKRLSRIFTKIHLHYILRGDEVRDSAAARAVQLSWKNTAH